MQGGTGYIAAASAGRQRYSAYLEEQKKEQQQAFKNRKWKIVFEEKAEFEKKEKRLASEISALQLDADSLAKEAEEKSKLVLVTKSNALRKAAKEKERALEKIKDELRELAKKRDSLWSCYVKGKSCLTEVLFEEILFILVKLNHNFKNYLVE